MNSLQSAVMLVLASALGGCFLPSFEKVGEGGSDACESATFPPKGEDGSPGGDIDFYVAWSTIAIGETNLPARPGFDLDATCTCCTECPGESTCVAPLGTTTEECDEVNGQANAGRDNNAAKYLAELGDAAGDLRSDRLSSSASAGDWSVLVRVFDYNGEANDAAVSVAVYTTSGRIQNAPPLWSIRRDSLVDMGTADDPIVFEDDAYVADNILVARFDDRPLTLVLPRNLRIVLSDATLEAQIDETASGQYRLLDGIIGGGWAMTDVFAALAGLQGADALPVACLDSPGYLQNFKTPLCGLRDLGPSASAACDTISFGLLFEADPIVSTGLPLEDFVPPAACMPENTPTFEDCE